MFPRPPFTPSQPVQPFGTNQNQANTLNTSPFPQGTYTAPRLPPEAPIQTRAQQPFGFPNQPPNQPSLGYSAQTSAQQLPQPQQNPIFIPPNYTNPTQTVSSFPQSSNQAPQLSSPFPNSPPVNSSGVSSSVQTTTQQYNQQQPVSSFPSPFGNVPQINPRPQVQPFGQFQGQAQPQVQPQVQFQAQAQVQPQSQPQLQPQPRPQFQPPPPQAQTQPQAKTQSPFQAQGSVQASVQSQQPPSPFPNAPSSSQSAVPTPGMQQPFSSVGSMTKAFSGMSLGPPPTVPGTASQGPFQIGPPPLPPMYNQNLQQQQQSPQPFVNPEAGKFVPPSSVPQQPLPGQAAQLPSLSEEDFRRNSHPRYMSLSLNCLPNTQSIAMHLKVPIGLVVQPMAEDEHGNNPVPVVNPGPIGIVRCNRCRTYINPFISWADNGRRWRCNLCGLLNEVPTSYFSALNEKGQRTDRNERPELNNGSVEFVAPGEYMVRPPQPPVYFFVIDVSANAVNSGMTACAAQTIKQCLDRLPGSPRTQIGFLTFDSRIHFYNLRSSLKQPQMFVIADLTDVFIPLADDLLVNLAESRDVINSLLDALPTMFRSTNDHDACFGAALNATQRVVSHIGGKVCAFLTTLPIAGEGYLPIRENLRFLGTDKEHTLLNPAQNDFYDQKAKDFSKYQICVELFLFPRQYVDVASLSVLPKQTAGSIYYYPGFNYASDNLKFSEDLKRCLIRETAFEAVMRVRSTRGLRISNFHGNFLIRGSDLLSLPNCSPDSTYAFEFVFEEATLNASTISFQSALLYTASCGERRIRVHNSVIPVSSVIEEIIRSININCLCNILAKQALQYSLKSGLEIARTRLQQVCIDILRNTRVQSATASLSAYHSQQQTNVFPESVQLLPLYIMSLQKNMMFRGGVDIGFDERVVFMTQFQNMSVMTSRYFIYPRLFSIHDMPEEAGQPSNQDDSSQMNAIGTQKIIIPPQMNLSYQRLTSDGIFLLENGLTIFLWIGRNANSSLLTALFGLESLHGVNISQLSLTSDGNPFLHRLNNIIRAIREERKSYLQLHFIHEGGNNNQIIEKKFKFQFVEDVTSFPGGTFNYSDFMGMIQQQISTSSFYPK